MSFEKTWMVAYRRVRAMREGKLELSVLGWRLGGLEMSRLYPPSPILARPARPSSTQGSTKSGKISSSGEVLLPPGAQPGDFFKLLRNLIEADQIHQARRLIHEAVRRFPSDREVRRAKTILVDGKAKPNPYSQPTATAEIQWLANPPEEARGKWVALIGREVVGMADSVEELRESLSTQTFDQFPVVQHLAR